MVFSCSCLLMARRRYHWWCLLIHRNEEAVGVEEEVVAGVAEVSKDGASVTVRRWGGTGCETLFELWSDHACWWIVGEFQWASHRCSLRHGRKWRNLPSKATRNLSSFRRMTYVQPQTGNSWKMWPILIFTGLPVTNSVCAGVCGKPWFFSLCCTVIQPCHCSLDMEYVDLLVSHNC